MITHASDGGSSAPCDSAPAVLRRSAPARRVLAISGSLRAASINSALLRLVVCSAPADFDARLFQGIGELALFNPDIEAAPPAKVVELWDEVTRADALVIASPEYAHGVSGVIKNALDWLVGHERFAGKPVVVFNASPRAQHADAALKETLRTMAAVLVEDAALTLPLLGAGPSEEAMSRSPAVTVSIKSMFDALRSALEGRDSRRSN